MAPGPDTPTPLLGGLSPQAFLDQYWQQKPLLIRQALPAIKPPCSAQELAGLCCDTETASRIILEHGSEPWEVRHAPFDKSDFLDLPDSHWTLLVNDLEQYYPELQQILAYFRFVPDWRIDDLMISYAADQGSVGPHLDEYDVFLIQLQGKRRWQLDYSADPNRIIPDIQLRILEDFKADEDWLLEPGDMLYLPPGLAHYGVAQGACMTCSVGFRAPDQHSLLSAWIDVLLVGETAPEQRFRDPKRLCSLSPSQLQSLDIEQLKDLMLQALRGDDQAFEKWLGAYLTEAKADCASDAVTHVTQAVTDKAARYIRNPSCRLLWTDHGETISVFLNGQHSQWSKNSLRIIEQVADGAPVFENRTLGTIAKHDPEKLLTFLMENEFLIPFNE